MTESWSCSVRGARKVAWRAAASACAAAMRASRRARTRPRRPRRGRWRCGRRLGCGREAGDQTGECGDDEPGHTYERTTYDGRGESSALGRHPGRGASASAGRRGRAADLERDRHHPAARPLPGELRHEQLEGDAPELRGVGDDGRHGRVEHAADVEPVEADHREVVRNAQPERRAARYAPAATTSSSQKTAVSSGCLRGARAPRRTRSRA